jgi:hypothetical protein
MILVDKRARYNTKGLVIVRPVEVDTGGGISYLSSLCCTSRSRHMNTSTKRVGPARPRSRAETLGSMFSYKNSKTLLNQSVWRWSL